MAFANVSDIAARLGRDPEAFGDLEVQKYEAAISDAQALIETAIGRAEADLDDESPAALRGICVTVALRIAGNPEGLSRHTESIGAHSETKTYNVAAGGSVALTDIEELIARRAVYGTDSSGPTDG